MLMRKLLVICPETWDAADVLAINSYIHEIIKILNSLTFTVELSIKVNSKFLHSFEINI